MSGILGKHAFGCLKAGLARPLGVARAGLVKSQPSIRAFSDKVTGPGAAEENRRARQQLAASYRVLQHLNMGEGICNHLTMLAPAANGTGDDVMLLVAYGTHWSEVRASGLVGVAEDGRVVEGVGQAELSASCIHRGIRLGAARPHRCIFHAHPPYTTALGCLKDPRLLLCHQTGLRFWNKIAYDTEFPGYGSSLEEGTRLGRQLADKDVLIMGNHGVLTVGDSAAWCFDSMYYIERLAMTQILAMSTGRDVKELSDDIVTGAQPYMDVLPDMAQKHFDAHVRLLEKHCPEYAL